MSMETDLFSKVTGTAGVSALISTRFYPLILPQNATIPAATYTIISGLHEQSHQGSSGLAAARLQISAWGATPTDARSVAEAIRVAIHGFAGTMGATENVAILILDGPRDDYEDDTKRFRRDFDYQVHYKEVQP